MRTLHTADITKRVAQSVVHLNANLAPDLRSALKNAAGSEISPIGKTVFDMIEENLVLAEEKQRPVCQDTGMVVAFVTCGQDVHVEGGSLEEAIHQGVREGYTQGYLRKSVVADPLDRTNTGDNTPAVIHYRIVPGETFEITLTAKGFGSENKSRLKMLMPSDGEAGVIDFVLEAIEQGAPFACAPVIVGVGIGGTFEKSALLAKEALLLPMGYRNENPRYARMEETIIEKSNASGIGPMGMGGLNTVLDVRLRSFPTHIAGLPVAVNMCCYVNRHEKVVF